MNDLSRRREARLFAQLRRTGDADIREELVRRYLPLARRTARGFERTQGSAEDLFQVACYALLKAVDGFDPARGVAFTTYAIPTITGELKRHAREVGWGLRMPRGLQERVLATASAVGDLTSDLGRSPTTSEIAAATGLSSEEVLEATEAGSNHLLESLDVPLGGDGEGILRIDALGTTEPGYELVEDVQAVGPTLAQLAPRERRILELRFGDELPQSEIARELGISQMHVSRLLRRTLDYLARQVGDEALAS